MTCWKAALEHLIRPRFGEPERGRRALERVAGRPDEDGCPAAVLDAVLAVALDPPVDGRHPLSGPMRSAATRFLLARPEAAGEARLRRLHAMAADEAFWIAHAMARCSGLPRGVLRALTARAVDDADRVLQLRLVAHPGVRADAPALSQLLRSSHGPVLGRLCERAPGPTGRAAWLRWLARDPAAALGWVEEDAVSRVVRLGRRAMGRALALDHHAHRERAVRLWGRHRPAE